ncbi:MAG TPA: hypothetical protein DCX25_02420 [Candidatus Pacebacteria bacterium]|nr:MAG: hypothetical protein UX00_C0004G0092 [Microgenomates group bacterium GW2011_GWB1_45_17]KKU23910.1 MAG: hypothetical protein UX35_C0003G0046 [Microgenomates group bacterium GW2011_GWA1_46_15]KKU24697.1 MAG: hypothetical protein UX36_C0001G0314 [Microgenomates group bacterium GW2011_GWC1_46_15]HAV15158.1 hypothetical protein [Candidatus Paceibacterota bacterium]HCR11131.1 hypothetical protein [Candidatus Paceibacterota bacterium]
MKYKALLLDLDGTTVPMGFGQHTPTKAVKNAIIGLRGKVHVCIATGRAMDGTLPVLQSLGISDPCILCGGAVIYNPAQAKTIEKFTIPDKHLEKIFSILGKKLNKAYVQTQEQEVRYDSTHQYHDVTNIFIQDMFEKIQHTYLTPLRKIRGLSLQVMTKTFNGNPVLQISHHSATKQQAINHLITWLKVKPDQIVAVGDGENDLPMIIAAGMGVAMGNAADGLKSVADYIAPSVDEDGVAHVIEKFFS